MSLKGSSISDASIAASPTVIGKVDKAANGSDFASAAITRGNLNIGTLTPVVAVATTNITRSGLFPVDGIVTPAEGDPVLVPFQTDATKNGVYTASSGGWSRDPAFNDTRSTRSRITWCTGGNSKGQFWYLDTSVPITVGTSPQTWRAFPTGQTIQDEGSTVTQRNVINFVGAGVTVTDSGGKTVVTIPGSGGALVGNRTESYVVPVLPAAGTWQTNARQGVPEILAGLILTGSINQSAGTLYFDASFDNGATWTTIDSATPAASAITLAQSGTVPFWRFRYVNGVSAMTATGAFSLTIAISAAS